MALQRLNYFDKQFLMAQDFIDEQQYHVGARWRLTRLLHTPGIVSGLDVVKKNDQTVAVTSGAAIDNVGREIILDAGSPDISLGDQTSFPANTPVIIAIKYHDDQTSLGTDAQKTATRLTEHPTVAALNADPTDQTDGWVVLGRFTLDANRKVPDGQAPNFLNDPNRKAATSIVPPSPGSIGRMALDPDLVKKIDAPPIGQIDVDRLAPAVIARMTPTGPDLQAAQQRHAAQLHTPGVTKGLEVVGDEPNTPDIGVTVNAGEAIDSSGRELIAAAVHIPTPAPDPQGHSTYYIVFDGTQPPHAVYIKPMDTSSVIILAKVDSDHIPGTYAQNEARYVTVDLSVRQRAGAVLAQGSVSATHLTSDVHAMLASPPALKKMAESQERMRKHLHTPGILHGLDVRRKDEQSITITPGVAADGLGREIVLEQETALDLSSIINKLIQQNPRQVAMLVKLSLGTGGVPQLTADTDSAPADGSTVTLASIPILVPGKDDGFDGLPPVDGGYDGGVRREARVKIAPGSISTAALDPTLMSSVTTGALVLASLQRLRKQILTPGIVEGLVVTNTGPREVAVSAGVAIDGEGREMVFQGNPGLSLKDAFDNVPKPSGGSLRVYVAIVYGSNGSFDVRGIATTDLAKIPKDRMLMLTGLVVNDPTGRSTRLQVPGNRGDVLDDGTRQLSTLKLPGK